MGYTVREKADIIGTFRRTSVTLMETLARWVPTAPELEAKALFGRHIWDLAQHADAMGQRTSELRAPMHHNRDPLPAFGNLLQQIADTKGTPDRLTVMYDAAIPHLDGLYEHYLTETDQMLDEPTVRILEGARLDFARMRKQREQLVADRPDLGSGDTDAAAALRTQLESVGDPVNYREPVAAGDATP